MNNKAQAGVGTFILLAITAIVGLILLTASAQNVGKVTDTVTLANYSFTSASEGNSFYITTYKAIDNPVIYNATGTLVPSDNYTVTNNVIDPTTGGLSVQVATGSVNAYANDTWNVSGTAQPLTYDSSSGGRAVSGLIVLFMALAIAAIVIGYGVKSGKF